MRTLVIAKNLKYFLNHIEDRFEYDQIMKVNKGAGIVYLKNGDELIYINSNDKLRGYHNVDVVMWSVPEWYDVDETEILAKMARKYDQSKREE